MSINKSKLFLLIFSAGIALCFYQSAVAQSGRHLPKPIYKPVQPSVNKETEPPDEKDIPDEKIEYLLIVGDILYSDSFSDTMLLNSTLDYCLSKLENQPNLKLKAEVGGRMNFKEAQDRAKSIKNVYILWIGLALENLGKGKTQVKYANYSILTPGSAKKLFTGRVDSEKLSENSRVTGSKKSISEELIYRLLRGGWLN